MSRLTVPKPIVHPEHGIESLRSFIRRTASIYSVSPGQLLRYLFESSEICNRIGESPRRPPHHSAGTFGYSPNVLAIVERLRVITTIPSPENMTLLKVSPALSAGSRQAQYSYRRICPICQASFSESQYTSTFEPLLWTLSTVSYCHIHRLPLEKFDSSSDDEIRRTSYGPPRWRTYESWDLTESILLIRYCADASMPKAPFQAPQTFLREFLNVRGMGIADFAQLMGDTASNVQHRVDGMGVTLETVFRFGRRLAISPLEILVSPVLAARSTTLFDIADHARTALGEDRVEHREMHPLATQQKLRNLVEVALSKADPLPPFREVCHSLPVSTGFGRYHLGELAVAYTRRRRVEANDQRVARRQAATAAAHDTLRSQGLHSSLKRTERAIREQTGLPKLLVREGLRAALADDPSMKSEPK